MSPRLFRFICLSALAASVMLTACATPVTQLPSISASDLRAEALIQERGGLQTQLEKRIRLATVGRPILVANAELCPKTRRDIGLILHQEDDYPRELRLAARRELGAGQDPSVLHVIKGSPAEASGFQRGDRILHDGNFLSGRDKTLRTLLDANTVPLTIMRGPETLTLTVMPETVCKTRLRYSGSTSINARATGTSITMTRGMMDFTLSDDELAQVIGHELAHNMMGHIRKVATTMILSGFAKRYARPFESEADYVGLYYMVRAGYDPTGIEAFWRRLAEFDPRSVNRARTHPTFPDRYLRLAATQAEIAEKLENGEPLRPNLRPGKTGFPETAD